MAEVERELFKATIKGFSRIVILWLLSRKPMSGYSLSKELNTLTGWNFYSGVVYPLLYDLEKKKLVAGKWTRKGRRRIKYYSVTENGVELLNRLREFFQKPVKDVLKDLISEV
jgi:DNA-binding PadR family transcriptional regulator